MQNIKIAHIEVYNTVHMVNDVHNAFMNDNAETLKLMTTTENQEFEALKAQFLAAFAEEEKLYKFVQKTPCRAEMYEKSDARMRELGLLQSAIKLRAKSSQTGATDAVALLEPFTLYANEFKKKTVETLNSAVRNLLQDLSTETAQAALTSLNVMDYFTQVKKLHEETEALTAECRTYDSKKIRAALLLAREKMDEMYYIVSRKLEGFANTFGAPFMEAAERWNASIVRFKAVVKNRATAREIARRKQEANANKPQGVVPEQQGGQTQGQVPGGQTPGDQAGGQPQGGQTQGGQQQSGQPQGGQQQGGQPQGGQQQGGQTNPLQPGTQPNTDVRPNVNGSTGSDSAGSGSGSTGTGSGTGSSNSGTSGAGSGGSGNVNAGTSGGAGGSSSGSNTGDQTSQSQGGSSSGGNQSGGIITDVVPERVSV